jgi:hypothetical protein
MVANEAMIVADSELSALNHLDYFAHTFKMPFNIFHDYQNKGKRYGEFVGKNKNDNDLGEVEVANNNLSQTQKDAKASYNKAMEAETGTIVNCQHCSLEVTKKTFNHVFCGNKGIVNCKDEFANTMNPQRTGARK